MIKLRSSFLRSLFALAVGCVLSTGGEARAAAAGTLVVSIAGPVTDAAGSVWMSGQATIETTLVVDEFSGDSSVLYSIHLTALGSEGMQASGEAVLIRPFASSDTLEVPFTFGVSDGVLTRTASATLKLELRPMDAAAIGGTGAFAFPASAAQ